MMTKTLLFLSALTLSLALSTNDLVQARGIQSSDDLEAQQSALGSVGLGVGLGVGLRVGQAVIAKRRLAAQQAAYNPQPAYYPQAQAYPVNYQPKIYSAYTKVNQAPAYGK